MEVAGQLAWLVTEWTFIVEGLQGPERLRPYR
jgi:hypothetical protein